jgi:Flp pilus assembly protein TadD
MEIGTMKRVVAAVEAGRCVLAVSAALLKNGQVLLALTERAGLPAVALSGPQVAPTVAIGEDVLSRVAHRDGLLVIVAPEVADQAGLKALGERVARMAVKPGVLVVDRSMNALQMMGVFPGAKVEHLKVSRSEAFFRDLPALAASAAPAPAPKASAAKAEEVKAVVPALIDRDGDVAAVRALLDDGGPIVVLGPAGIGKLQVVEDAVSTSSLTRLPDLVLSWGSGADTLAGRMSAVLAEAGENGLAEVLNRPHTPVEVLAAMEAGLAAATGLADKVMVIHDLHHVLGREADFFRKGRVEVLVRALLINSYALRIVFTSEKRPVFYRTAHTNVARVYELTGIKGRFYHEIFTAVGAPEFPRDRFGPMSERLHGNPFAIRLLAIEVRDSDAGVALTEDPKALTLTTPDDTDAVRKLLKHQLDRLGEGLKDALAKLAHLRYPAARDLLGDLGIKRKDIDELMKLGLLEMTGGQGSRKFQLHNLVRTSIPLRVRTDFETYAELADLFVKRAASATGTEQVALQQEANRFISGARGRANRGRFTLPFPDNDERVEACAGLIRGERPAVDIAGPKVDEVLAEDPGNSEAWILRAEMLDLVRAEKSAIEACYHDAMEKAPVPEVFHQACGNALRRKVATAAIVAMEKAIAVFPDESRLHTRLGALLLKQGRRNEALAAMKRASELDPMLPDAYGLLGMARREEGVAAISDVDQLLREAVRLAPEDPVQVSRLVDFIIVRARVGADQRAALFDEAKALLDPIIRGERRAPEACLQMAVIVREEGGDRERARWLLKQARKLSERNPERSWRIKLEFALLDAADGKVTEAEASLREITQKEGHAYEPFFALGHVLATAGQLVPAHAELIKARDRTPATSLERILCEADLAKVSLLIQAAAQAMAEFRWEDAIEAPPEGGKSERAGHVVKRSRHAEGAEPAPAEPEASEPEAVEEVEAPAAEPEAEEAPAE